MNVERAAAIWQEVVVVNCGGTINMDGGAGAAPGEGVRRLFARLGGSFDRSRLVLDLGADADAFLYGFE